MDEQDAIREVHQRLSDVSSADYRPCVSGHEEVHLDVGHFLGIHSPFACISGGLAAQRVDVGECYVEDICSMT